MVSVGFAMVLVTLFSNGQVESMKPISESLYVSQQDCEMDKAQVRLYHPEIKSDQRLECAEVRR